MDASVVATFKNLQKRIHGDSIHFGTASIMSDPEALGNDLNVK